MKVKPSIWRITWRYLIVSVILLAALFGAAFSLFIGVDEASGATKMVEWGAGQYIFTFFTVGALLVFYILSITSYYYVIEDKYFIMKRYWKEFQFDYKNIQFIDIDESKRKGQVIFYAPTCRTKYLLGDKNGLLLETLIKKCPPTMSVHEFKMKHPEERY